MCKALYSILQIKRGLRCYSCLPGSHSLVGEAAQSPVNTVISITAEASKFRGENTPKSLAMSSSGRGALLSHCQAYLSQYYTRHLVPSLTPGGTPIKLCGVVWMSSEPPALSLSNSKGRMVPTYQMWEPDSKERSIEVK